MSGKIVKRQRVQEKLNSQQRLVVAQHTQYSGPIPPASELEKYETILKGSANRILKVFENQSSHRMQLEKIVVRGGETMQLLGWISSLIITMTCII
jgi:uncharacterized membrane protein